MDGWANDWQDAEINEVNSYVKRIVTYEPNGSLTEAILHGGEYREICVKQINHLFKQIGDRLPENIDDEVLMDYKKQVSSRINADIKKLKQLIEEIPDCLMKLTDRSQLMMEAMHSLEEGLEKAKDLLNQLENPNDIRDFSAWQAFVRKEKLPKGYEYDELENYQLVFYDTGSDIFTTGRGRGLKTVLLYLWLVVSGNHEISAFNRVQALEDSALFTGFYLPPYYDQWIQEFLKEQEGFTWLSFGQKGRMILWEAHNGCSFGGQAYRVRGDQQKWVPMDSAEMICRYIFQNQKTYSLKQLWRFACPPEDKVMTLPEKAMKNFQRYLPCCVWCLDDGQEERNKNISYYLKPADLHSVNRNPLLWIADEVGIAWTISSVLTDLEESQNMEETQQLIPLMERPLHGTNKEGICKIACFGNSCELDSQKSGHKDGKDFGYGISLMDTSFQKLKENGTEKIQKVYYLRRLNY